MVRPPLPVERPPCPVGHPGVIRLHGVRYTSAGKYGKARFRCVPAEATTRPHTFVVPKRSPTHLHLDGITCSGCERDTGRADGPSVVAAASFSLSDAARLLSDIGAGLSLRKASRRLRIEIVKSSHDAAGNAFYSKQNALAADYLDRYGPAVVASTRRTGWPPILVLDSQPLNIRVRTPDATRLGIGGSIYGGAVLMAAGSRRAGETATPWHAGLAGGESAADWWDFLNSLPADPPPRWVVADGAKAIRNAVAHAPRARRGEAGP